ncbi:ATP-binding protein [Geobacter pickeringii]|uniref:histidine kinase n=1 Tax=Geobacter pickeringii TaxID=345632 RepID=A0A0B5B6V0_9BACT|nr:ATP-binding protein [Geobacter pickeringii]AJE02272.1 hypothetical protein GPICK_01780 [Geobacter pickeringii]
MNRLVGILAAALVIGLVCLLYDDFDYLDALQKERTAEKETLFDQVVAMKSDPVRHLVMDYSFWDDMVKFVAAPDPAWARGNIDSSFASYRYSALWIYRPDGALAYSVHREGTRIEHGAPSPIPSAWIAPLLGGKEEFPHFFIATPRGVMELTGAAIHSPRDGDRHGRPHGFLMAGVLWDDASVAELARLTRSTLVLRPAGTPETEPDSDPRRGVIVFSRPLAGLDGKPVSTVVVRMDAPDIRQLVREMDDNALIGTALVAVLAVLVVFVLLSRQRLKNANINLDAAQQTAQMGSWQREFESGVTSWSDNLYRIFGLPPGETVPGLETFYALVHPDDLPRVREAIERSVREKSGYEIEFRLIRPDGAVRIFRSRGESYLLAGGRTRVVGSTQDITERSLIERRLAALVRQKDAFITRLGHDMKTPLTPLMILLPLIRERVADGELARMADICHTSASHIEGLAAKALKLARLAAPVAPKDLKEIPLAAAVDDALRRHAEMAAQKRLRCENGVDPALAVPGVPAQIEELFLNLLSNAASYSPEGSLIRVTAEEDGDGVTVAVRDDGIGLEPEQLDLIFDEFYRGDEARHELGRPGLGLAICRRIVLNHQGNIWAESAGRGEGTTIRFTLPRTDIATNITSE